MAKNRKGRVGVKTFLRNYWKILVAAVCGLALLAGGWAVISRATDPLGGRIAAGVSLGGLDVSGMTPRQARAALKEAAGDTILTQPLVITLPEGEITLEPKSLGLKFNRWAAVKAAYQVDRVSETEERSLGLLPYLTLDTQAIREALQDYAQTHDTTLTQPAFALSGPAPDLSTENALESVTCQSLTITLGIPQAHLDVEATLEKQVLAAYDIAYTHPAVAPEMTVTVQPESPDLEAIAAQVSQAPVNDNLNMQTYAFEYGSYGYDFDREAAEKAISQASYGQSITIPMVCTQPEILGDDVYFRDVLGSCDTKHNTNENRNNNLRLLCQAINGYVLQPGEEFSYNTVVGERTAERGYLPAPAYSGNRLANSVGGGVCQGSSTLYNCVLLADLEVTNRVCHGATISYLPLGLDAAVNWGTTDFCFRNNWNFPIKIQAEVTEEYLCMKILGTDEKNYYLELSANSWRDDSVTYATSYKLKYDKQTGELISKDRIGYSTYYHFD